MYFGVIRAQENSHYAGKLNQHKRRGVGPMRIGRPLLAVHKMTTMRKRQHYLTHKTEDLFLKKDLIMV